MLPHALWPPHKQNVFQEKVKALFSGYLVSNGAQSSYVVGSLIQVRGSSPSEILLAFGNRKQRLEGISILLCACKLAKVSCPPQPS